MADARLILGLGFYLVASMLVIAIGVSLARREIVGEGRRAARAYAVWWIGLGGNTLTGVLAVALGRSGADAALFAALVYVQVAWISVMLWGIVYYLVYLFTGRAGTFWPITAFYVASFVAGVAFIASLRPVGVTPHAWGGVVAYANEPSAAAGTLFVAFFLLPPIAGALAYGSLFFRLKSPTKRYRVGLVSMSIVVWFSVSLASTAMGAGGSDLGEVVTRLAALAAIGGMWFAYHPPPAVRRLGIRGLEDEAVAHAEPEGALARRHAAAQRAERLAALQRRTRELV